jgi:hypothetical protein
MQFENTALVWFLNKFVFLKLLFGLSQDFWVQVKMFFHEYWNQKNILNREKTHFYPKGNESNN